MKKVIILFMVLASFSLQASGKNVSDNVTKMSRGDVKIIEATENIRYLSQKIAKEYLFFYAYPQNRKIKKDLRQTLKALSNNLQIISAMTKDADTNNILEFLAYSKEEILNILQKEPSSEYAILMLDYSETLLEGADSIGRTYAYTFSREEEMLVVSKNISYLLERIMKYYMALYQGYNTQNNRVNLHKAIAEIKTYFARLNRYEYPEKIDKIRQHVNLVWQKENRTLKEVDHYFIPVLLADSVIYMEKNMDLLALYHSQNL